MLGASTEGVSPPPTQVTYWHFKRDLVRCPQRTPNVENGRPGGRLDMSGVEGRKRMSQGRQVLEFYSAHFQGYPSHRRANQNGEAGGER